MLLCTYLWLCVNVHVCDFSATVRVQPRRPTARNNPDILRRDPDLPPSFVDQDCAFENTTG